MKNIIPKDTTNPITDFEVIISIIEKSRERAFQAINQEFINMYWEIGAFLSNKVKTSKLGKIYSDGIFSIYPVSFQRNKRIFASKPLENETIL